MPITLHSLVLLLAVAVVTVVACRKFKLPPMLGYLLVGMLIGPFALGFIQSSEQASHLAEYGIVFLMFTLGLEFNLAKLNAMRRVVFGLGTAQVGAVLVVIAAAVMLTGLDWRAGLVLGAAAAMSSTAMVSKLLSDRGELNAPHGQNAIGILLFQDLAVVPFLIIIPALSLPDGNVTIPFINLQIDQLLFALFLATIKIIFVLVILLSLGQKIMRPWFNLVAKQHANELFMINILLVTLGTAWLTEEAGLSLALGAFLAGMLIAETEYRYQVEDDIRPFRDLLLGLFFVTVGMNLNFSILLTEWGMVLISLLLLGPVKIAIIAGLARLFGNTPGSAWRTGFALGQGGEFAFVLLALIAQGGLVPSPILQATTAGVILSMMITPLLIQHSDKIVLRLASSEWMNLSANLHNIAVRSMAANGHVILCGFGRSGQSLSRILSQEDIHFFALDLDPEKVKEAASAGESVVFGDAAKREVLIAAGLMRARAIIVTYSDTHSAMKILELAHQLRPEIPVIVRTQDDSDIDLLKNAGAAEVVSEVMEGSLMLASHTMMLLGVPLNKVIRRIRDVRETRYQLIRGFYRGANEDGDESERQQPRLHTLQLTQNAHAIGYTIAELQLEQFDVEIRSIRRRNTRPFQPEPDFQLSNGDVLVLLGEQENLAAAEMLLLQGK